MPSFVPSRRTYSALSSSLSSPDDTHNANIKEIVVHPSDSSPRTIHRYSFLVRFIIFVILEFGFIALVTAALRRPILLHVSFTNSEVKGGVTVIAIIWHALAVYVVKDILLNIFSAEWIRQYDGSKRFTLQDLDVVSRLTTGFIDHARHCMSTRATLPFCLSFMALLLLMLLNGLTPSAIGVDLVYRDYQSTTQVANLTLGINGDASSIIDVPGRANALIQLEIIQNLATVGFSSTQPNVLIPWPSSDSVSENISMRYESDVIWSNTSCSWKAPGFAEDGLMMSVDANQQPEPYELMVTTRFQNFPVAIPLTSQSTDQYISPILLMGANHMVVPLGIPSSLVPCNNTVYVNHIHPVLEECTEIAASALFCDPQLKILPATINVTMSSLDATILPGAPTVKNIPTDAANYLFNTAIVDAIGITGDFSDVSDQLFFPRGSSSRLRAPEQIEQRMTKLLASAAKAYLSGYVPGNDSDPPILPSFAMVNTSAVIEEQRLALVARKPFFIASSAIVGLLVVLLGAIVAITRPDQLESFDLENIVRKLN